MSRGSPRLRSRLKPKFNNSDELGTSESYNKKARGSVFETGRRRKPIVLKKSGISHTKPSARQRISALLSCCTWGMCTDCTRQEIPLQSGKGVLFSLLA